VSELTALTHVHSGKALLTLSFFFPPTFSVHPPTPSSPAVTGRTPAVVVALRRIGRGMLQGSRLNRLRSSAARLATSPFAPPARPKDRPHGGCPMGAALGVAMPRLPIAASSPTGQQPPSISVVLYPPTHTHSLTPQILASQLSPSVPRPSRQRPSPGKPSSGDPLGELSAVSVIPAAYACRAAWAFAPDCDEL